MSRIYDASFPIISGAAIAGPMCDLESSAIESPAILAVDFSMATNTTGAGPFGLGKASNTPVALATLPFIGVNPNDPPCTSGVAVAWSTAPAVPASFYRMFSFRTGSASGNYILLTFPRGLKIAPSASFVLWDLAAVVGTMSFNSAWEIEL